MTRAMAWRRPPEIFCASSACRAPRATRAAPGAHRGGVRRGACREILGADDQRAGEVLAIGAEQDGGAIAGGDGDVTFLGEHGQPEAGLDGSELDEVGV